MKAVIFDRDGVIIDSESTNVESAVRAFEKLGIKIKENEKKWIVGRSPADYKEFFLKKYNFSYEEFRKIQREIYHKIISSVPLFEKTILLIKKIHEEKIPLALTTSGGLKTTLDILKRAGLENSFDVIVTKEDYEKRKPHPEPYIVTARKLNLNPKDCVVIEDTEVGVESAKDAGMKCIALPNECTKDQDFSNADMIIRYPDELNVELLLSL